MSVTPKKFKAPPKRFQPKGLVFLYEDHDILVVDKAPGILTIGTDKVRERTAYWLLTDYVRKGNSRSRDQVFIVHRLDRDTSGVIVFAKTEKAKIFLQEHWPAFTKTYHAVVHGTPAAPEGTITSYLMENSVHRMYSVPRADDGKLAMTHYKVLRTSSRFSLLEVALMTGRKNQIRAHLSEHGHPVAGDRKYALKGAGYSNAGLRRMALHSTSLTLVHPHTRQEMTFKAPPPPFFNKLLSAE